MIEGVDVTKLTTAQEIFDYVAEFLFKQGKPSRSRFETCTKCFYRHPDEAGVKCAVGALILDNEYNESMEGSSIEEMLDEADYLFSSRLREHKKLLQDLQIAHDSGSTSDWVWLLALRLAWVARDHSLDMRVLLQVVPADELKRQGHELSESTDVRNS